MKFRRRPEIDIASISAVTVIGRRVVIVRVFVKKSQKTPAGEIALALSGRAEKRADEIKTLVVRN